VLPDLLNITELVPGLIVEEFVQSPDTVIVPERLFVPLFEKITLKKFAVEIDCEDEPLNWTVDVPTVNVPVLLQFLPTNMFEAFPMSVPPVCEKSLLMVIE